MGNFSETQIQRAWEKAQVVDNNDSNIWRKDPCNAWIKRSEYGNKESKYGWEIDHAYPSSLGGKDDDDNLRAMHHENNRSKADDYPSYSCAITSKNTENVPCTDRKTVNDSTQLKVKTLYNIK